jgi:hypothetical protein
MTISLCRFVVPYSPPRPPAHPRFASIPSTQSIPRPAQRVGRNLGLRYQQLESSIRDTTRMAALVEGITDTSGSVEKQHSVLVHKKSGVLIPEEMEMFHGLAVPKEPKPPEPDGAFFRYFILSLMLRGLVFRMLHVRMCGLCLRSLRRLSVDIQSVACFISDAVDIHGNPRIGVDFTHQVFVDFSGHQQAVQHKP